MDVYEAIRSRRAVREYSDARVERALIHRLIDAAVQAPSAVNEQPWSFVVVEDKAALRRIARESTARLLRSPPSDVSLVRLSDHFREILHDPDFDIFYGAPTLIVIASVSHGGWAVENCALAAENLMLAACAEGLGSCWIGFAQGWLSTPDGKTALGLAPESQPVAPIIVGHPKSPPKPVPRGAPRVRWI